MSDHFRLLAIAAMALALGAGPSEGNSQQATSAVALRASAFALRATADKSADKGSRAESGARRQATGDRVRSDTGEEGTGIGRQGAELDDQEAASAAERRRAVRVRGAGHVSVLALAASDTFDATLGTARAVEYGAGGALLLPRGFFVAVDVARSEQNGERVFVDEGQVFGLGIPMTVSMTPIELTAGYRIGGDATRAAPGGRRLPFVPYAGGGVGWLLYEETSSFADPRENVDESFTSYHVLGGVELPLWRMLGTAAELGYRWVPDALDESTSSVAPLFGETNLGGLRFRVKVNVTF